VHVLAYEAGTECSETSAYKFQTPGNHPKESIQQSFLVTNTDKFTLCREILAVFFCDHKKHMRVPCGQNTEMPLVLNTVALGFTGL